MDDEFRDSEVKRVTKVQAQDRADYTAELNGNENGRMGRFGLRDKSRQDRTRKEREKQSLAQALMINAAYAKLYNSTLQLLHDTRNVVYEAQLLASAQLEQAEKALAETLEQASKTPDGLAVFVATDGNVYDESGQKLDDDAVMSVLWRDGAPSWENYQQRRADLETKQERFDRMNAHSIRIDELQAKMDDEDNPPSMEELEAFKDEINAMKIEAETYLGRKQTYEATPQKPIAKADLNLNF